MGDLGQVVHARAHFFAYGRQFFRYGTELLSSNGDVFKTIDHLFEMVASGLGLLTELFCPLNATFQA